MTQLAICSACHTASLPRRAATTHACPECGLRESRRAPRAPTPAPLLAFDLDGTILNTPTGLDYTPDSVLRRVTPNTTAIMLIRGLHATGYRIAYVTGRGRTLNAVTQHQLERAGAPPGELRMSLAWAGEGPMAVEKGAHLRSLEAAAYCGDLAPDDEAARLAGIPFVHADVLRAGRYPLTPFLSPAPRMATVTIARAGVTP